jgi:hypothetical protein
MEIHICRRISGGSMRMDMLDLPGVGSQVCYRHGAAIYSIGKGWKTARNVTCMEPYIGRCLVAWVMFSKSFAMMIRCKFAEPESILMEYLICRKFSEEHRLVVKAVIRTADHIIIKRRVKKTWVCDTDREAHRRKQPDTLIESNHACWPWKALMPIVSGFQCSLSERLISFSRKDPLCA